MKGYKPIGLHCCIAYGPSHYEQHKIIINSQFSTVNSIHLTVLEAVQKSPMATRDTALLRTLLNEWMQWCLTAKLWYIFLMDFFPYMTTDSLSKSKRLTFGWVRLRQWAPCWLVVPHRCMDRGPRHQFKISNIIQTIHVLQIIIIHWASKETCHFFRATLTKIHAIKIDNS